MDTIRIKTATTTFFAQKAGTRYEMDGNAAINTTNFGIEAIGSAKGREIVVDGDVHASVVALRIGTNDSAAAAVDVVIGRQGSLDSAGTGILSNGHGHRISNAGDIHGGNAGIVTYGAQTIVNSGEIDGSNGINFVSLEGRGATLRNSGVIEGGSNAILGSDARDIIVNSGEMTGNILLGAGDDLFVFKGGEVDGKVRGSYGNDAYVVKVGGLDIVEESGQGWDKVTSFVDHGLANNVEALYLAGKGDITGVGNADDNQIYGNAGDNALYGSFGDDFLSGRGGDDLLAGADGADQFHFSRRCGHDTIIDFEGGNDKILIDGLTGASDFADMMAHHVSENDGDVWIAYGKDVIVIQDTAAASLKGGDVLFV